MRAGVYLAVAIQEALDSVMLANDKLFVVLAVVLIIWAGIVVYIFKVDRRLVRLEKEAFPPKPPPREYPKDQPS